MRTLRGGIITDPQATAPNVTTAYSSGNLGALADNGGTTKTMAPAANIAPVGNRNLLLL